MEITKTGQSFISIKLKFQRSCRDAWNVVLLVMSSIAANNGLYTNFHWQVILNIIFAHCWLNTIFCHFNCFWVFWFNICSMSLISCFARFSRYAPNCCLSHHLFLGFYVNLTISVEVNLKSRVGNRSELVHHSMYLLCACGQMCAVSYQRLALVPHNRQNMHVRRTTTQISDILDFSDSNFSLAIEKYHEYFIFVMHCTQKRLMKRLGYLSSPTIKQLFVEHAFLYCEMRLLSEIFILCGTICTSWMWLLCFAPMF